MTVDLDVRVEQTTTNDRLTASDATSMSRSGKWPAIQYVSLSTIGMPARELWLWTNPVAMASLDRGLKELGDGKGVSLGSFAAYADDDID